MPDLVPVRRALLSVSDKLGLVELARELAGHGCELISTGGTAKVLAEAGLAVTPVEAVTGFPEMMDGRVKTLHPMIHGGLLARRDNPGHVAAMTQHGIEPIDLVCVNLYPFEKTVADPDIADADAIEQIDIGGPSMVRSAAKNHDAVAVVTDPSQYGRVLEVLAANDGATTLSLRRELAADAFARTAAYDTVIAAYFDRDTNELPRRLSPSLARQGKLRYGENPHQPAAVYRDCAHSGGLSIVDAEQLHGKALSYNNYLDAGAAARLVRDMAARAPGRSAACVVKHTNPCGASVAGSLLDAVDLAIAGDPMASYGGILAVATSVDLSTAQRIAAPDRFFEVVIAPGFDPNALDLLRSRWKNIRLLVALGLTEADPGGLEMRSIPGGMLAQVPDDGVTDPTSWQHRAGPAPTAEQLAAAGALEPVCRALSSNAVLIGGMDGSGVRLFGAGAGQMDRVASCKIAIDKAGDKAAGAIAWSDAFFPFPDGPELLIEAGVGVIVHPGGSKRDSETFELCDARGVTCLTTGVRHFRH